MRSSRLPALKTLEEYDFAFQPSVKREQIVSLHELGFVDEIGYLPVTRSGATLFFQLIARRYEHASTAVTSNKGFEEWGRVLGDEVMAGRAAGPAVLHRCHIVNIRGNSWRTRRHAAELAKALQHPPSDDGSGDGGTGP